MQISETADRITVAGAGYCLHIARQQPTAELSLNGRLITTLLLASGADTMDAADEQTWLDPLRIAREPEAVTLTWRGHSALWAAKTITLRAWDQGFSYGYTLTGQGDLARAHLFRTQAVASQPAPTLRLFNPEPNSGSVQYTGQRCTPDKFCVMCNPQQVPERIYSGPPDFMTISVGRDKDYHDGNWFFTPAPFCYAVEGNGNWLGLGVAAAPGAWNFSELVYPGGGFGFSLVYDGHERVDGVWHSPQLVCLTAPDEYQAVERYCAWLREQGLVPTQGRGPAQDWWSEPIFCGWGEQVSQEVAAGGPKAAGWATQANYERWLQVLEAQDLHPGTVVIDDKWQRCYGLNDVDCAKWPDLPGFIAGQHRRGRYVLLWLKAWDPEGLPLAECIRDASGAPLAVDPAHPAARARLTTQVRFMLRDLDADGFKIDFTHLIPRGRGARSCGGRWGLELLRQWLGIISTAAREAKPEALIIAHTANPYLADLVDMLRLNDVAGLMDPQGSIVGDMRHRVRIARAASPWWLLDADNWPCSTRVQWRGYISAQAGGAFGVPSLYHAERLGWGATNDALQAEDYAAVRAAWATYRSTRRPIGQPEVTRHDIHPVVTVNRCEIGRSSQVVPGARRAKDLPVG
jgi:hypothetical protein